MSLPNTDDAKFCSDDHGESRKSVVPRDEPAFDDPFQPSDVASFRFRRLGSVPRDGCFIGSGDAPRDDSGEGVAPRDRIVPASEADRVVDRPAVEGCMLLSV